MYIYQEDNKEKNSVLRATNFQFDMKLLWSEVCEFVYNTDIGRPRKH